MKKEGNEYMVVLMVWLYVVTLPQTSGNLLPEEIEILQHMAHGHSVMEYPTLKGILKKGVFSTSS